ncbi:MAG: leucine--tRNA ligase [Candidatus Saccharimonadales bacterium]
MKQYNPKAIETKWQKEWNRSKLYEVSEDPNKPKAYITAMFPYPSGTGLHVGHVRNYSITDTLARYHRQKGCNVLTTVGWDAFGLPAENYAIKTGIHPAKVTAENIVNFKSQLKRIGMSYDWSREINTTDPQYYKWTQWIFLQLFENNLAYQAESLQWWCPECKTVLANEQVIDGCCWRHEDIPAEKKRLKQWFFRITEYAEDLLAGLDDLPEWPEKIKSMQRNWIGKSQGAEIDFKVDNSDKTIKTFTTRIDTIYGATYLVLAPEHPLVDELATKDNQSDVDKYVSKAVLKSEIDRQDEDKPKTGVFTGSYAINPVNQEKIPIWVADYVLMGYGSGAIMAVPAHDMRDYDFAAKYELPIINVINPNNKSDSQEQEDSGDEREIYTGEGLLTNSDKYNGISSEDMRPQVIDDLSKQGLAEAKTTYKLRDWLISRQRYWGVPIPIIHCQDCGPVAVPEDQLPVELPEVDSFIPTGGERSVLATIDSWVNVDCPECGGAAQRETDTMDGYACSSWYYLRYTDANNDKSAWDKENSDYWMPLDYYCGGDHAVSHLLYSRFWMRFFYDQGLVSIKEPVKRLVFNGYINAEGGVKMSKSKGNVVDPLDIIDSGYGADSLRLYELFIAPYELNASWDPQGVVGTYRFLNRVWNVSREYLEDSRNASDNNQEVESEMLVQTHRTIKKVTDDLDRLSFNTAIAGLMEYVNYLYKAKESLSPNQNNQSWQFAIENLLLLLAPFAPHITEELWSEVSGKDSIHLSNWPKWDDKYLSEDEVTIIIQINGKLRGQVNIAKGSSEEDIEAAARKESSVQSYLEGKEIKKAVVVPDKLINFVI